MMMISPQKPLCKNQKRLHCRNAGYTCIWFPEEDGCQEDNYRQLNTIMWMSLPLDLAVIENTLLLLNA